MQAHMTFKSISQTVTTSHLYNPRTHRLHASTQTCSNIAQFQVLSLLIRTSVMTTMIRYMLLHRSLYVCEQGASCWQALSVRMKVREASSDCVRADLYEEQAQITSLLRYRRSCIIISIRMTQEHVPYCYHITSRASSNRT
jgi:hypothetical protein